MPPSSAADWSGTSVGEDLGEASGTPIGVFSLVETAVTFLPCCGRGSCLTRELGSKLFNRLNTVCGPPCSSYRVNRSIENLRKDILKMVGGLSMNTRNPQSYFSLTSSGAVLNALGIHSFS